MNNTFSKFDKIIMHSLLIINAAIALINAKLDVNAINQKYFA
jgi:hypothetical protein